MARRESTAPRTDGSTDARVIGELLRERARKHPDQPYLGSDTTLLTYAEVDDRTDRAAAGLVEAGVAAGDRVAVISANRIEMLEIFFACAKSAAVEVPLNAFLKGEFLRYQLDDSQASTLVVDGPGWEAAAPLLEHLPQLRRVIAMDELSDVPATLDVIPWSRLESSTAPTPDPDLEPSSLQAILYTSGTTGMPKGCMLPHGWYMNGARVASEML
ncbi:MAG: AMP-binding protein [Actinomycetota bacterium]